MSTIDYYNQNSEQYISSTQTLDFSAIQEEFLCLLKPDSYILDYGCGSGRDTRYFLNRRFRVDAVDGSEEMVRAASVFTGIEVRKMNFEELNVVEIYDGIWACASILHVPLMEISDIFKRMKNALKQNGILYASFKYGDFAGERDERYFTDMTADRLHQLLEPVPELRILKLWYSEDVRVDRENETWLNVLLRKQ